MRLFPLLLLVLLAACQVKKKPDLAQLYQQHGTDHSNTPLVLIHGTMGSKLRLIESHQELWPGNISQLIFSNYKVLANKINPDTYQLDASDIEAYAIFDSYSGLSIYDEIIETLTTYGSYHLSDINQPGLNGRNLYVFHYDWRQDNVQNAQLLAKYIDKVLQQNPSHHQVDVVAHSMGGLILRYYQRFGDKDILDSLSQTVDSTDDLSTYAKVHLIRHAIFLGTPQLGSVITIKRLQQGFDFNLRNIPVEVQATMPSVFQLLPHPLSPWATDADGNNVNIDLYDPSTWQKNQWSIYNPEVKNRIIKQADSDEAGKQELSTLEHFFNIQLKRAKLFWLALSPQFEVAHEGFIIMGGDCKKTLGRLIVEQQDELMLLAGKLNMADDFNTRANRKSILFEPGDGQVSKSSLLGEIHNNTTHETVKTIHIKYPIFVCEDHIRLTQNITFQDNLLHVLLNQ